jgi:hypothetical protein
LRNRRAKPASPDALAGEPNVICANYGRNVVTLASVFSDPGLGWGLRGDPYLWEALGRQFGDVSPPNSEAEFVETVERAFLAQTGEPLMGEGPVFVEKFAHGGMSSGHVCREYWRDTVVPLLTHRFRLQASRSNLNINTMGRVLDVRAAVNCAFTEARNKLAAFCEPDKGKLHRKRSLEFVESLSDSLLAYYSGRREAVASLSKHHDRDRVRFGMNELLYDVSVVEFDEVHSGKSGKNLSYVTNGLWLVESEMAQNKREALYDFNKLVLGSAENLLFVGPHVIDEADYLRILGEAAKFCSGRVFVALIPHPKDWGNEFFKPVDAWEWRNREWVSFSCG